MRDQTTAAEDTTLWPVPEESMDDFMNVSRNIYGLVAFKSNLVHYPYVANEVPIGSLLTIIILFLE